MREYELYEVIGDELPALDDAGRRGVWLRRGEWTLWRYGPNYAVGEEVFGSRAEAEVRVAALGYGIGRPLARGRNSRRWELSEL